MNMRQHKRNIVARIAHNNLFGIWYGPSYAGRGTKLVELFRHAAGIQQPDWVGHDDQRLKDLGDFVCGSPVLEETIAAVEQAKVEFVCLRLKDHVVVDTFDTYDAALALVKKHIKGKKAKLYVTTSLGETINFTEEELAV